MKIWGNKYKNFVGLRAKLYACKTLKGEEKKRKGVKKGVVEKTITFDNYRECLFSGKSQMRSMNTFRSRKHEIYTESVNKTALSSNDDKRYILPDGENTLALGHYRLV